MRILIGILFVLAIALIFAGNADARGRLALPVASVVAPPRPAHKLAVLREAARHLGGGNPTGKPGAWCAWFVSYVLERAGLRPLADGLAYSALRYGPRVRTPEPGDLVVMHDHVGIVEWRLPDGSVQTISGNWGHRVARHIVAPRAVLAFVGVRP